MAASRCATRSREEPRSSELEKAAGRRLFGIFGNPMTSDPSVQGKRYNTGNADVVLHGGQLLALMEGAPPVALDPRKLDTLHEETHGGLVTSSFSAHPKIDYATREMIDTGAAIHGMMGPAEMRYEHRRG
jgi:carotenoid cleavage dioxygenase